MSVKIKLTDLGSTRFVSRAQASGLMNKVKETEHVTLDFSDIRWVSQSFCTELFRLADERAPKLHIDCVNTSESVRASLESHL